MPRAAKGGGWSFVVNTDGVARMFRQAPKIFNSQMNRTFPTAASKFLREFSKARLKKGIYQVRRRVKARRKATGQPSIPAKARAAGFTASVRGRQDLDKKEFRIRNRNPLITIREKGGVIRPKRGEYLYVRGDFRGRGAAARRTAFQARQAMRGKQYKRPIVAKVRQVVVAARLGFYSTWRGFRPTLRGLFRDGLRAAVKRMAGRRAA